MDYVMYCKPCDAITGHEIHGMRCTCRKCGKVSKTPVLHWAAGILVIGFMTVILCGIIWIGGWAILKSFGI